MPPSPKPDPDATTSVSITKFPAVAERILEALREAKIPAEIEVLYSVTIPSRSNGLYGKAIKIVETTKAQSRARKGAHARNDRLANE